MTSRDAIAMDFTVYMLNLLVITTFFFFVGIRKFWVIIKYDINIFWKDNINIPIKGEARIRQK